MNDFLTQRKAMVDSQVRPSDVTDRRIPRAMQAVERERFVPSARRSVAYMDGHVRITDAGAPRYILTARLLAKLIQSLDIADDAAVLDLGCGTGYSTAILSHLTPRVVGVESDAALAEQARSNLSGTSTIKIHTSPLQAGAPHDGPFDAILINGAIEEMPAGLLDQLKDGGRLACVRLENGVGKATLWRRYGTHFDARPLFDAEAPAVPGFQLKAEFVF